MRDLDLDPALASGAKTTHEGKGGSGNVGRIIRNTARPFSFGQRRCGSDGPCLGYGTTRPGHLYGGWIPKRGRDLSSRVSSAWAPRRRQWWCRLSSPPLDRYTEGDDGSPRRSSASERLRHPCSEYARVCVCACVGVGTAGVRVGRGR